MGKLLFSLGVVFFGLALGYLLQILMAKNILKTSIPLPVIRKTLQKLGLWGFMSVSFLGAIWVVHFDSPSLAALPVLGLGALTAGGILGLILGRVFKMTMKQKGSMFICGAFTNIGSIGALVCFVFLGEAAFALAALYKLLEEVFYYGIGFPVAKYYSGEGRGEAFGRRLVKILTDPFVLVALAALLAGTILNLSGVPRPHFFETVNTVFIPLGTILLLTSIGLGMKFEAVGGFIKESLAMSAVKFVLTPILAVSAAFLLGYHQVGDGLAFKVVLIVSSMPVAFNALVATSIYDLDLDLANACWFVTTCGLLLVVPWLYWATIIL